MPALIFHIAETVLFHVIQLIAGCLLAFAVYVLAKGKLTALALTGSIKLKILTAAILSLCGTVLPLGIYGLVPLLAVLLAVGFEGFAAVALLVSNVMFNMLVPYTDPSFIWRTGIRQVVFAFLAGLLAGLLLLAVKSPASILFRSGCLPGIPENQPAPRSAIHFLDDSFKKLGLFLVAGVLADIVFQRYILGKLIGLFYLNSFTAAIPMFFGTHDVSNPFFLLTFSIVYMLLNLVKLSALVAILRPKGLLAYFGYYVLLALLLSISAFV